MFATLLGSLPRPPVPANATAAELLAAVVRAQEAAGLEPLSDAGYGIGDSPVERWRATSALTDRPVKQALVGPYSVGQGSADGGRSLEDAALATADTLRAELVALAAAGCSYLEIHEPAAVDIGADTERRRIFRDAHARMLDGVVGPHLSLAITGADASATGAETLLASPYASLAVDLIAGPDNWRLVVAVPGDRGIVCGALPAEGTADDRIELLLWAAGYAASTGGRGPARVGLATASSLAGLHWDVAMRKLSILGEAARLADLPPEERRQHLDPRAVDIRSAALGRVTAAPRKRRRRTPS
jgi:methionine synthase II (cobalamin-independent)